MILDAQIGTGYSFVRSEDKKDQWEMEKAIKYFIRFMKQFYMHHEDFKGRSTYIVGQDFFGGKMIPLFVKALHEIDSPAGYDDFTFPYQDTKVSPDQKWLEWINLSGVAIGSPVIDEAAIRSEVGSYAKEYKLISIVEKFALKYPQEWFCANAAK